ncbi:hypothetical protein, partial [Deinococcus pimensis]|uniref:AfsR/SARP family transcriptional regulator n=1 Tax=Deinococcus pimensis TaxID=309888 RepID=UPI0005EB7532
MPPSSSFWHLSVLGRPRLVTRGGAPVRLGDRAFAVLAYLALEGPSSRSRVAGLLWPDSPESTARNNLVHVLRRTIAAAGGEIVEARETLSLAPGVTVDVPPLADAGAVIQALLVAGDGALLDGMEFEDAPDFSDW